MPNALANESSPYLRAHGENPVDWFTWGEAALSRARELDRPLLLSIGYSACHWCHVMEHESFADPAVAAIMNASFVCVKVDREERPDIDALYMEAVQGMTGHGGWPLTVFLTPEQIPFYGGTYFPPQPRHGMPSFTQVLEAVADTWSEQSAQIRAGGERIRVSLGGAARLPGSTEPPDPDGPRRALETLQGAFDQRHAGFGGAPKFPQAPVIEFLLAHAALTDGPRSPAAEMAIRTLSEMARGGIHDQLGGGFHRYSVDRSWTVPHFEKMLYDNALLAGAYLHGFQLCGEDELLTVCMSTLDWALSQMRAPEGGFYSAIDADSEGVEGRFYVWREDELRQVLGADAQAAIDWFGVSPEGNFDDPHHPQPGLNVLRCRGPRPADELAVSIRERLLDARRLRSAPAIDDKRLTSWNALMIEALAQAGALLTLTSEDPRRQARGREYLRAASECADFILERMRDDRGRLLRCYGEQGARIDGFLEDYAFTVQALSTLYEAGGEQRWFDAAVQLCDQMIELFGDPVNGGFYSTAADHSLIARRKDLEDSPIPAGGSSAAFALLRLAALGAEQRYERLASDSLGALHRIAVEHPQSFGHLLRVIELHLHGMRQLAILGEDRLALERCARVRLHPDLVIASAQDSHASTVGLLADRDAPASGAVAYLCERFSCRAPCSDPSELERQLNG